MLIDIVALSLKALLVMITIRVVTSEIVYSLECGSRRTKDKRIVIMVPLSVPIRQALRGLMRQAGLASGGYLISVRIDVWSRVQSHVLLNWP